MHPGKYSASKTRILMSWKTDSANLRKRTTTKVLVIYQTYSKTEIVLNAENPINKTKLVFFEIPPTKTVSFESFMSSLYEISAV